MKRKEKWLVDVDGYPRVNLETRPNHSRAYPALSVQGVPDGRLWNAFKRFWDLIEHAAALISIAELLLLPPILTIPALHVLRWIVEALEGIERALSSMWVDLASYVEWLLKQTENKSSRTH